MHNENRKRVMITKRSSIKGIYILHILSVPEKKNRKAMLYPLNILKGLYYSNCELNSFSWPYGLLVPKAFKFHHREWKMCWSFHIGLASNQNKTKAVPAKCEKCPMRGHDSNIVLAEHGL